MALEVILMNDVPNLGITGDVVRVSEGYARNYLMPRQLAAPVTAATRRQIEKKRQERAAQEAAVLAASQEQAARVGKLALNVVVKAGAEGKLFGAVTAAQIAEALAAQGIPVERHQVDLPEPLRELGKFEVPVRLHPQVTATLKVWVVEE